MNEEQKTIVIAQVLSDKEVENRQTTKDFQRGGRVISLLGRIPIETGLAKKELLGRNVREAVLPKDSIRGSLLMPKWLGTVQTRTLVNDMKEEIHKLEGAPCSIARLMTYALYHYANTVLDMNRQDVYNDNLRVQEHRLWSQRRRDECTGEDNNRVKAQRLREAKADDNNPTT